MSVRLALTIALVLLFLLAILVIVVAGLVRRPRREWQVAVMGQAQEVRYVGSSSVRGRPVKPRKVSLDEMWAANSVPQSAYVGAPRLPDRDQVAAALAPASDEILSRYRAPVTTAHLRPATRPTPVPAPPPPPRDYLGEDPFYEPEVVTGEISLFNAAVERPDFDDAQWEGVNPADAEGAPTLGVERAKEVLSSATAATTSWFSTQATTMRGRWDRWRESRAIAAEENVEPARTPVADSVEDAVAVDFESERENGAVADVLRSDLQEPRVKPELDVPQNDDDGGSHDDGASIDADLRSPAVAAVEESGVIVTEAVVDDLPSVPSEAVASALVEPVGDTRSEVPADDPGAGELEVQPAQEIPLVPAPPPAADDLERWITGLRSDSDLPDGAARPRWRRAEDAGEPLS